MARKRKQESEGYLVTRWNVDRALKDGLDLPGVLESAYSNPVSVPREDNVVTFRSGKYRGIQFLVVGFGFESEDTEKEDFKVQIVGKTSEGWKNLWVSEKELKYLGRMPSRAEDRFNRRIGESLDQYPEIENY